MKIYGLLGGIAFALVAVLNADGAPLKKPSLPASQQHAPPNAVTGAHGAHVDPNIAIDAGQNFYVGNCAGCHQPGIAPPLNKVLGRKIASVVPYPYCDALKAKSGQTWTPPNLRAFLSNTQVFAPGCTMELQLSPDDITHLIAYFDAQL